MLICYAWDIKTINLYKLSFHINLSKLLANYISDNFILPSELSHFLDIAYQTLFCRNLPFELYDSCILPPGPTKS